MFSLLDQTMNSFTSLHFVESLDTSGLLESLFTHSLYSVKSVRSQGLGLREDTRPTTPVSTF